MKHTIYSTNDQNKVELTAALRNTVKKAIVAALDYQEIDFPVEISLTFVDNEKIHELNREYRGKDAPTDVLSFPLGENGEYDRNPENNALLLGDIVISYEHAVAQADLYGHSIDREIAFLTVHSMLHLLGYDHLDEGPMKKQMRQREEAIAATISGMQRA